MSAPIVSHIQYIHCLQESNAIKSAQTKIERDNAEISR